MRNLAWELQSAETNAEGMGMCPLHLSLPMYFAISFYLLPELEGDSVL